MQQHAGYALDWAGLLEQSPLWLVWATPSVLLSGAPSVSVHLNPLILPAWPSSHSIHGIFLAIPECSVFPLQEEKNTSGSMVGGFLDLKNWNLAPFPFTKYPPPPATQSCAAGLWWGLPDKRVLGKPWENYLPGRMRRERSVHFLL